MSQNWTPPPAGGSATVPNNMVLAIISIFCCWPLAIPAIIFASQVNQKIAAGDVAGAQDAAKKAKTFSYIAFGLGALWVVFVIIYIVFVVGIAALSSSR
ncbi:MAG TPA: CD225/dispanin family protein [Pyrinomonadaceae bacterium]